VAERYFQPEEVQALIPQLTRLIKGVMRAHEDAVAIRDRLQAEQERVAMAGGAVIDRASWRADQERLGQLSREVQASLNEVLKLGGVPKDLNLGLVDFPHLRDGHVVNLCWKYGEREVRFWHGLDEGYTARKPL
jgi:hypothetical protein